MNINRNIFLLFLITALLCGCDYFRMTFKQVKAKLNLPPLYSPTSDDIKQALPERCGVLMGNVISKSLTRSPLVIIASSKQFTKRKIADYTVLPEPGPYMLYVPEGRYNILAFADFNNNLICEQGEFVGRHENPETVSIAAGQVIGELDFVITSRGKELFNFPIDLRIPFHGFNKSSSLENGGTVSLDDGMFSKKYGSIGLWAPSRFIEAVGVDIYALEKFDKAKIPILFVHGSGGTPKDWEFIVNRIDRDRYQPWLFYYPSGLRLQTLSDLLNEKLNAVYNKYKFEKLYITAHSLGGMIARSYINQYDFDKHSYCLKLFISISTPWGGVDRAKLAPKHSFFKYPPSWKDLAPESKFIQNLFQKELPPQVKFCLFFSYRGDNILLKGADDGSIALNSQLDPRAQSEAAQCFGFNENHVSILFSKEVIRRHKEMLSNVAG